MGYNTKAYTKLNKLSVALDKKQNKNTLMRNFAVEYGPLVNLNFLSVWCGVLCGAISKMHRKYDFFSCIVQEF